MLAAALAACGTGDPVGTTAGTDTTEGCTGSCAGPDSGLSIDDVEQILAQGIAEAEALDEVDATLAVVDRVGNVLAVYRMGDPERVTLATDLGDDGEAVISGGLEGLRLPTVAAPFNIDDLAAIAKAITGAYLSSEGNAFSTRTASQIVQEHFNPQEELQPGGPLFGVQFSQLACSDLMRSAGSGMAGVGPQRSPLGLSADPGGFPLYRGGAPLGGVGVMADGIYGLDAAIADRDDDVDEAIAYAASFGFAAPVDRRADRITADGKTLRFSDVGFADLPLWPDVGEASEVRRLLQMGELVPVNGYFDGAVRAGTIFGQPESGIRRDDEEMFAEEQDAFVLVDAGAPRYPPRSGTDAAAVGDDALRQEEVQAVLASALAVANRTRAQIRRPVGTQARVTISVVDSQGEILGVVRTRDAPVFGIDVSLQKARSAAFFSSAGAATFLQSLPDAKYLRATDDMVQIVRVEGAVSLAGYLDATGEFLEDGDAFRDGSVAYSARALGNIARPFFPDGIDGAVSGPLSKPAGEWSVLSTGLQLDLSINAILQHVLFAAGAGVPDVMSGCAGVGLTRDPPITPTPPPMDDLRLANGLQIFPGGVPIYRGATLVGAIGVSGDGVDQDDMIAFLGVHDAGVILDGAITNAPADRRADTISPRGVRLRYVQCPQAPFLDDEEQRPCAGK